LQLVFKREKRYIYYVKRQQTIMICLAGGLSFLPLVCSAVSDDNPYKSIVDRNAFDLDSPPDPTTNAPAAPPSDVKLTGIVDIFDKKQALLLVKGGPGKPDDSYILGEGERQDAVEVVAIDETAGTVKVNNAGIVSTLTFDKDGVSADSGAAPGSGPHAPPAVGNFANPRVGVRMIPPPPARNFRLPQAQNQPQEQPQAQPYQPPQAYQQPQGYPQSQSYQQPQAIINPFQSSQQNQTQAQTQGQNEPVSPEVQAILMEKLRAEHPEYPPMPPTPLTPADN
jgi:hypothetical protein